MKIKLFQRSSKNALEKRFSSFTEQLQNIFGMIKQDIGKANSKLSNLEKEQIRLNQWISYLNSQNFTLSQQNEILEEKYDRISAHSEKLSDKHEQLHEKFHESHNQLTSNTQAFSRTLQDHQERLKSHKSEVSEALGTHKEDLKKALESRQNLTDEEVERLKRWTSYYMKISEGNDDQRKALEAELGTLRASLSESTQESKSTISTLRGDNLALKQQLNTVSQQIENLRSGLDFAKSELSETKDELENTRSDLENTQKNIENLRNLSESESLRPVEQPQVQQSVPQNQVFEPQQPQIQQFQPPAQHSPFERHIISRVMPNRKGYIMRFIVDLASEKKFSTKEIEEITVKEKNLCGRTSFYAYLKELKIRGRLGYATIDERSIVINLEQQQPNLNMFTKSED